MASRLFTVDLDLGLNKAKRFIFEDFSSAPTGTTGRVIYWTAGDSAANHLKVYNGSTWKTVAYTDDLTSGTVTSVGIAFDTAAGNVFGVSNSPITSSGDITLSLDTQSANYVFAGPTTGSSAAPTFRALADADIPVDIARVADIPTAGTDYIAYSEKGAALGVAELNGSGFVPAEQLDLTNYVTLNGTETLTGSKTFSYSGLYLQDGWLGFWQSGWTGNVANISFGSAYDGLRLQTSGGNIALESLYDNIVLSGQDGEYLNSVTSANQIATIGDLSSFITGYTETDPVFVASEAYSITSTDTLNWDTAYGWGNHASAGYLTSITNSDTNLSITGNQVDLATDIEIAGDLIVQGDLTVNGDVTTINTATLAVEDNVVVLNTNVTGSPTTNAGIEVERGTSTNASILWDETADTWKAGLAGSEYAIALKRAFTINTTGGTPYTVTHSLGTQDVIVQTYLGGSVVDCDIDITDSNAITVTTNSSETSLKVVVIG